jgi:transcriptional regulator with XRE-family HTH domain
MQAERGEGVRSIRGSDGAWMRALGLRMRQSRRFLGLSQEQLAIAAGVSQGAVSRLEAGTGLATPYLVVLHVQRALAAGIRKLEGTFPEVTELLEHPTMLPNVEMPEPAVPTFGDEALHAYVAAYRDAAPQTRTMLRTLVQTVAKAPEAANG